MFLAGTADWLRGSGYMYPFIKLIVTCHVQPVCAMTGSDLAFGGAEGVLTTGS